MKGATDEEVRPIALKGQGMVQEQNATFLIDDRVQLVKELQVDGVHLGKNDMPIAKPARFWAMTSSSAVRQTPSRM